MKYFFPVWNNEGEYWRYKPNQWYQKKDMNIFLDESAHKISGLLEKQEKLKLVIVEYNPQFRYFLNEHLILESSYWSVFDEIQGVKSKAGFPVSYQDIEYPEGGELNYTPFGMLFLRNAELVGQIELGDAGQILWVDYIEDKKDLKRVYLDDRGFKSSILYMKDNIALSHEYFDQSGEWVIREHCQKKHDRIEVNPNFQNRFKQNNYDSMEKLIEEKVKEYSDKQMSNNDLVVLSSHDANFKLISEKIIQNDYVITISSNFVTTYSEEKNELSRLLQNAKWLWFNYQSDVEKFHEITDSVDYIVTPPFDNTLTLGKSNQIKKINITVIINTKETGDISQLINHLNNMMEKSLWINVNFYYFGGLTTELEEVLNKLSEENMTLKLDSNDSYLEAQGYSNFAESRVTYSPINKKSDLLEGLTYSRLIIDWHSNYQNELTLIAMKVGIPIIVQSRSNYIEHKKNGWLLEEDSDLESALYFYINNRNNWNHALAYNAQYIDNLLDGNS